jgi:dUTP pyrophosphatase
MTPSVRMTWAPDADQSLALPTYETEGAAGADLRANFAVSDRPGLTLHPGERRLIPTGLHVAVPPGYEMQIRPRSGLALKQGLTLVNTPGTIDSDYRGPLGILVINHGAEPITIIHGQRIAQAVIAPVLQASFDMVETLDDTARGSGGFGSTGQG